MRLFPSFLCPLMKMILRDIKWGKELLFFILLFTFLGAVNFSLSQQESKKSILFQEDELLDVRLGYSFKEVKSRKSDEEGKSGYLFYGKEDQGWDSIPIITRGRGNFRRDQCFFTPLKVHMKKKEVKGTLFEGNKTLKVVLPCQNAKDASDFLVKEYICYKLYEPLSPYHFNSRLINLNLTDEGSKQQKAYDVKAIFIEDDGLVADRFGAKLHKGREMNPMRLQDTASVVHDFFQFFIGNTDWSAAVQHNVTIMQLPNTAYIPLCYDFDMTGMVNAQYATVSEKLNINSVRQRLYRGFCRDEALFQYVRAYYLEREPMVWEAFHQAAVHLSPKEVPAMKQYMKEFFDILKNDKKFKDEIFSRCRGV
ncbi:hypothetical protein [Cecembia calidifontis]|uniref:Uncharacterized protein n=1 Tax=Cecembia calidifontis TaxID=1187080 RepID=A0A4Q7P446_9BACT|nr:hypothetical protein [Cecembia calidifontis]RZS94723.1 hypothetical protein BC751_0231 [Cecembia calidifontis]